MSDQDPPKPSVSTSTVPLKKETVRISLRAQADDSGPVAPKGATAPIPLGGPTAAPVVGIAAASPVVVTAPIPVGGPTTAPVGVASAAISPNAPAPPRPPSAPSIPAPVGVVAPPSAPRPMAPTAPGIPVPPSAPSGPPLAPPGAKTIPLSKAPDPLGPTRPVPTAPTAVLAAPVAAIPAAASPIGAKTIPLAKAPGSGGPGPIGKVTTPLQPGDAKPLPQATVKMGQTQPMGIPGAPTKTIPKSPNIQSTAEEVEEDWEEEYEESGLMPFAIIVLILALAVLAIELVTKMGAGS